MAQKPKALSQIWFFLNHRAVCCLCIASGVALMLSHLRNFPLSPGCVLLLPEVRSWKNAACDTADQWVQTQVPSPPRDQYDVGVRCWGWHCLLLSGLALIRCNLQIDVEQ